MSGWIPKAQRGVREDATLTLPVGTQVWLNGGGGSDGINGWVCERCNQVTVVRHADRGVTPMFLGCRATPGCDGMATSLGYQGKNLGEPTWEWYRPGRREFLRLAAEMKDHIMRGGLQLREIR